MKVMLERKDWQEALEASIVLLKNAMAQIEVYKLQVELAEKKISEFPPEPKKDKKI